MARSSLLWIERDEVRGLLGDLQKPQAVRRSAIDTLVEPADAASAQTTPEYMPAAPTLVTPTATKTRAAVPAGLDWTDIEALSRADFDRAGARLIAKLLEDPEVIEAFVSDSDGLLLLGDHEDVALPVVAAELTGRWHSLRGQLDIGSDPGVVSVRLDDERQLEAVAVPTGSHHLRILAWLRRAQSPRQQS